LEEGNPVPMNEFDVDNAEAADPNTSDPAMVEDERPDQKVVMSKWRGRHTAEEFQEIIRVTKPDEDDTYGPSCKCIDKDVEREIARRQNLKGFSQLTKLKAQAVKRIYYQELVKMLRALDPGQTIRGKDGGDINVLNSLSDEISGLFSFVPRMMSSFGSIGVCYAKKRQIALSWYLSMPSYPSLCRHELTHAAVEILKPLKYPNIRPHGPEYMTIGRDVLKVPEEDLTPKTKVVDECYDFF
jgi:hypothetical protein